jgi:hypothetical protein
MKQIYPDVSLIPDGDTFYGIFSAGSLGKISIESFILSLQILSQTLSFEQCFSRVVQDSMTGQRGFNEAKGQSGGI